MEHEVWSCEPGIYLYGAIIGLLSALVALGNLGAAAKPAVPALEKARASGEAVPTTTLVGTCSR